MVKAAQVNGSYNFAKDHLTSHNWATAWQQGIG